MEALKIMEMFDTISDNGEAIINSDNYSSMKFDKNFEKITLFTKSSINA